MSRVWVERKERNSEMSKLIAMVATAVMVDGVRTVIQPGEALLDLSKHDERELLANGLAMDPTVEAANDKAKKIEEAAALDSFRAARERVQPSRSRSNPLSKPLRTTHPHRATQHSRSCACRQVGNVQEVKDPNNMNQFDKTHAVTVVAAVALASNRFIAYEGKYPSAGGGAHDSQGVSESAAMPGESVALSPATATPLKPLATSHSATR